MGEKKTTIIDVFRAEVDETTKKIGLFLLGLAPVPLIITAASIAYDAYKKWQQMQKEKKK